jgi:hypothetical protein
VRINLNYETDYEKLTNLGRLKSMLLISVIFFPIFCSLLLRRVEFASLAVRLTLARGLLKLSVNRQNNMHSSSGILLFFLSQVLRIDT